MSQDKTDTLKVEGWVLCLIDSNSGEPKFYYNPKKDIFERKFNKKYVFWSKEDCVAKVKILNVEGLEMLKGTMDVPKDTLIDAIMEIFVEKGLVKK